jgi:hypothetical protein
VRSRWLIGAATTALFAAVAYATFILMFAAVFNCSGTDTSEPADRDSLEGQLCEGEIGVLVLALPAAALLAGGVLALRGRRWPPLAVGAAVAALVLAVIFRVLT